MAQRGAPAGWDSPADRPSILQITVESAPRRRAPVRRAHVVVLIALLGAIAAAVAIALLPGRGGGSAPPPPPAPPSPALQTPAPEQPTELVDSGPPSATAPGLYRFPLGCPASGITAVKRGRTGPCSPHQGSITVVLRRVHGVWRGTLEPIDPSCSPVPVPPLARGKVKACRR